MAMTNLKAEIKLIDDEEYLATVKAGNSEGESHGNLGRPFRTYPEAVAYVIREIGKATDKLSEKSGKLPLGGKGTKAAEEDKGK